MYVQLLEQLSVSLVYCVVFDVMSIEFGINNLEFLGKSQE